MPWKNGLGITREVALHAPDDNPSEFFWRISLATVSGSGPFSAFPGIDRTIAVLAGDGMRLTVDGVEQAPLTPASEPYSFSGDSVVHADSIGSETTDLNIMTRRDRFGHDLRKVTIGSGGTLAAGPDTVALVFASAARSTVEGRRIDMSAGDVLLDVSGMGEMSFPAMTDPVVVFVVRVTSHG